MSDAPLQDVCPVYWLQPQVHQQAADLWGSGACSCGGIGFRCHHSHIGALSLRYVVSAWLAQRHGLQLIRATVACTDASHTAKHAAFVRDVLTDGAIPLPPAVLDAVIAWGELTPEHWSNMVSRMQAAYGSQCVEDILSRLDARAVTEIAYNWLVGGVGGPQGRWSNDGAFALPLVDALAGRSGDSADAVAAVQRVWAVRRLPPLAINLGMQPVVWRSWLRLAAWLNTGFIAPPPASTFTLGVELGEPLRLTENTEALTAWWRMRALLPIGVRRPFDDAPDHPAWRECVRMLAWHGVPATRAWVVVMDTVARATAVPGWENAVLEYLSGWRRGERFKPNPDEPCAPSYYYDCGLSRSEYRMRVVLWYRAVPPTEPTKTQASARRWAAQRAANASDIAVARELSWLKRSALVALRAALRPAACEDDDT